MKRKRAIRWAACVLLLVMPLGCGDDDEEEETGGATTTPSAETTLSGPSLRIASPASGAVIKGNVVSLDLVPEGINIVPADGDRSGGTGHYHVFIDRDPVPVGEVIPREAGIVHTTDDPVVLPGLAVGTHRFAVVYGDGAHYRLASGQVETTVQVDGPSVDATAPAAVSTGQPVTVTIEVEGISLVTADGDRSGTTGHLHLFIDRDPTPPGQPIPVEPGIVHTTNTTVELPNLGPGEHRVWVVVGDGAHYPLEPRVADRLTVGVS